MARRLTRYVPGVDDFNGETPHRLASEDAVARFGSKVLRVEGRPGPLARARGDGRDDCENTERTVR